MYLLLELLNKTKEMNASDLHLTVGLAPTIRCNGKLIQLGIDKLSSNYNINDELIKFEHEKNKIGKAAAKLIKNNDVII